MAWLTFQKLETLILLPDSESTCLGAVNWGVPRNAPKEVPESAGADTVDFTVTAVT